MVRCRVRVKNRVRVGLVFRVRVRFPLSIQWRGGGGERTSVPCYLRLCGVGHMVKTTQIAREETRCFHRELLLMISKKESFYMHHSVDRI